MAYRKNSKKQKKNIPMGILFWLVFFVVVAALFAINMPKIKKILDVTHFTDHLLNNESTKNTDDLPPPDTSFEVPGTSGTTHPAENLPEQTTETLQQNTEAAQQTTETTQNPQVPQTSGQTKTDNPKEGNAVVVAPEKPPVAERERTVFLVKVDSTGMVFTSPVKRLIAVSDSPMIDALNVLIAGPQPAEQRQGLTSLIPEGTRILSARVNGSTATINFSENFMFNNYGAEGYIAQLRQIVWTATEFPNVDEVQILIEGQKVDYLGESINIGRPISRSSL